MAMEREKGDEVSPTLPYDVVINILSRLPIKSIVRFRCVSKSWLTIYTDPHFVNLHLTQSPKFNIVFTCSVDEPSNSEYPFDSYSIATLLFVSSCDDREQTSHYIGLPTPYYYRSYRTEQVSIAGSCRGLVLCCKHSGTLYLVNPSTGEMIRLPESPFHETAASLYASASHGLELGYDSSVDDYKVVQLSPGRIIITSLYSLRSNSWKRIPDFPLSTFTQPGVFLNGNLHWFNSDTSKMACLSLADEKFGDVPLPADGGSSFETVIGVFRGCLCIQPQRRYGSVATFWVMKEYGRRDSWTKFEFYVPYSYIVKPLDFSNNDEDLFVNGDAKFVMYNLNEKTYRNLEFHIAPQSWGGAETCLESVVSPKCYMGKKRSYRR